MGIKFFRHKNPFNTPKRFCQLIPSKNLSYQFLLSIICRGYIIVPLSLFLLAANLSNNYSIGDLLVSPQQEEIEVPAGETSLIILNVEIPKNIYIYGNTKGPGTGKATTIDIDHPDNLIFDSVRFLPPEKHTPRGEKKFVWIYKKRTKLYIPFRVKEDSPAGNHPVSVNLQALLCSQSSCSLRIYPIECSIKVIPSAKPKNVQNEISQPPKTSNASAYNRIETSENGNEQIIYSKKKAFTPRYISATRISNIIQAILYGLIAGFILNFMPCVLPVVSIKIMSLIKHSGQDRRELVKLGLLFALGILSTFVILASLSAFMGYTWGELFQKRIFLIIMISVVFALTLSMFGVFTINIPAFAGRASQDISNQYADAFIKGLLATLLSTPCSGPFLGGTLAWALTQPPAVIFKIFLSVGVGMSLPYIALSVKPGLMRFIPKPGDWMITFERAMAFLLLATTLYLIGILESSLVMPTLWFLLFIAIALWQYERFGTIITTKTKRMISRGLLITIILLGYLISYHFLYNKEEDIASLSRQDFQISKLYENRKKGGITIVKFTASWCPNCKLVEKRSFNTSGVAKAIADNNISVLVADLTRDNSEAEAIQRELGSHSIPLLAIFPPGDAFFKPLCLMDMYSEKSVIEAIRMAKSYP